MVINHSGNYNVQVSNSDSCKIAVGIIAMFTDITPFIKNNNAFFIFPNPVGNNLQIAMGNGQWPMANIQVKIYNALGQKILLPMPLLEKKGIYTIDISGLTQGIYIIQLVNEKERWIGKFVKE